jgi:cytochrome c553
VKISGRDWGVIAVVVALIGFLAAGKGRMKSLPVPRDSQHGEMYELMSRSGERTVVEKGCVRCHGVQGKPLSPMHPPKEQCLICHKLSH